MNFRVGDTVRVKTIDELINDKNIEIKSSDIIGIYFEYNKSSFNIINSMCRFCGKEYKVKSINEKNEYYVLSSDTDDADLYCFQDWMLVPTEKTIIITTDGSNKTTVTKGNKEVSVSLYHEDKYDEFTGAVEALSKLYGRKSPLEEIRELKGEEDPNIKPYKGIKYKLEISKKPEVTEKFKVGDTVRLLNTLFPCTTVYPYKYYITEENYKTLNGNIFEVEDTRDYFIHTDGRDYFYQTLVIKKGKHSYSYPSFLFTKVFSEEKKFKTYLVRVNKTSIADKNTKKLAGKVLLVKEEKDGKVVVNGPKNKPYIIPKKYTSFLCCPNEINNSVYKVGDRITLTDDTEFARKYSKGTIVEKCGVNLYRVIYDDNFNRYRITKTNDEVLYDCLFRFE